MFTTEFDHDEITITLLDDSGNYADVIINSFDDIVYIRQFEEEDEVPQAIALSPQMWEELIAAIHSPEGAYLTVKK
tara:strand:+ start:34 stop:261 length:228 start_codon:yes stop_codon:yes gene_type:complete